MHRGAGILVVVLGGCNVEQGFNEGLEGGVGVDLPGDEPGAGEDIGDPGWRPGDDPGNKPPSDDPDDEGDDPPDWGPPDITRDGDCVDGVATVDTVEMMVGSHGPSLEVATVWSPATGWFALYNSHIVESGSGQWNESAYFRVVNATNPTGEPLYNNCGAEWVVQDLDNQGAIPGTQTYIGTFWLDAGDNALEMRHYCEIYRDGDCTSLHYADDSGSTCDSDNINSVHFYGDGICLMAR